jgi:hypothetical protein
MFYTYRDPDQDLVILALQRLVGTTKEPFFPAKLNWYYLESNWLTEYPSLDLSSDLPNELV